MGWIPGWGSLWMVHPFVLAPNFVSVTPFMDILFPILRRNEVSMRWSSFLIFLSFGSCILGVIGFWANIHLSVSAYQVTSFVIGLPHSGWYPPDTETKFGAKTKGWTIQRLPHPGIHPIVSHQTQTLLHMPARFCWKDPYIVLSSEAMPVPGKYRSGCSQSSIGWNTGPPMKKLEKVPKELTWSVTL